MTGLTRVVRERRWRQITAAVGLALAADVGGLLVQGGGGPRPGNAIFVTWLASIASPTTTISSSYGGALPFTVDAVHIDALGLNTPYIARYGTFDPDGPQDSTTDMRWIIEQRPDIVEGYLSGQALLRGAGPDEIIGTRRRKMILEMVSSPRFQREYLFVLEEARTGAVIGTSMVIAQHGTYDAPHIYYEVSEREHYSATIDRTTVWTGPSLCAATSGRPILGATRSTACRSARRRSQHSPPGEAHRLRDVAQRSVS